MAVAEQKLSRITDERMGSFLFNEVNLGTERTDHPLVSVLKTVGAGLISASVYAWQRHQTWKFQVDE